MKIAVHAKMLSEDTLNGMGYYTYNLLKAIASIDRSNSYDLYSSHPLIHKIDAENFHEKIIEFPKFWTYLRLPVELRKDRHDIIFVPHEKMPPFSKGRKVITVFDLHSLKQYFRSPISISAKLHFLAAITCTIKRADRILAISESTKRSILDVTGVDASRVIVTPLGYDSRLFYKRGPEEIEKVRKKYGIKKKYLINTSSLLWYRKNLPRVVRAFAGFKGRSEMNFIITGRRGEDYEKIIRTIDELGLKDNVILLGYVPVEDLPVLISGAQALVFPSLHEGFGLPIVEAMACGCPVITSDSSSMPEVAGDCGILIDPLDEDAMASAMDKITCDSALRERMIKQGLERAKIFSWEKTAKQTLKVFESLA
ncbi:MAG: glycosyltransferase family 4 protein [Deltaproteobacteria bacterium]|nr:glycosyltransferase family 4 protein [Deltaproteobacteria bacterium]